MPKGLQGQVRLADTIFNDVYLAEIAPGEIDETDCMQLAMTAFALVGGNDFAELMVAEDRSNAAGIAAATRWS
ncbi:MAG: hypothetical protein ACKVH0_13815 [Alphaproteobacteria bacterium]